MKRFYEPIEPNGEGAGIPPPPGILEVLHRWEGKVGEESQLIQELHLALRIETRIEDHGDYIGLSIGHYQGKLLIWGHSWRLIKCEEPKDAQA